MTAQSKTIIKSYFETGDRPTQQQFTNLIDSYQNVSSTLDNYQIVGTRCGVNGGAGFQGTLAFSGYYTRMKHFLPFGAKSISLVYSGTKVAAAVEASCLPGGGFKAQTATIQNNGTGYVVGDVIIPTVASGNIAPRLTVQTVSSAGSVGLLGVLVGTEGMFYQVPNSALATTGGTGSGLTVNMVVRPSLNIHVGLEQVWNNQSAYSSPANQTGVLKLTYGTGYTGTNADIEIPFNGYVVTDAVGVNASAGRAIGSRVWTNGILASQETISGTDGTFPLGEGAFYSATGTDYAWDGTVPSNINAYLGSGVRPMAIMGTLATPMPSFVIIGDSIVQNVISTSAGSQGSDTYDQYGHTGWAAKAINIQMPWSVYGSSGDTLANWINPAQNARLRDIAYMRPSHVVDELAINDFVAGLTYTQFKANKVAFWGKLIGYGAKEIWITTCTPQSTSTDTFATLVNQTPGASNVARLQFNASARAGKFTQYGVTKVLDVAAAVESGGSSSPSGKWIVGYTYDGTHPSITATTVIVAATTSAFGTATL